MHLDGTLIGPPGLFSGVPSRTVKAGDTVLLFGTGCVATNPALPSDRIVATPAPVTGTVKFSIGGREAKAGFIGLSGSGLCQVNAEIPAGLPSGDAEVILQIDGFTSADAAFIPGQ